MDIPFEELSELITTGCLSITTSCLGIGILGRIVVLLSVLCFLALLSISSVGRVSSVSGVSCTSSCGGVVGSCLNNTLASYSFLP